MMELQKQKLLLVFTMILVRATIHVETTSPSTMQKVKKTLLSALGMKRRPVIDRKKAFIPEAMLNLYKIQSGYESTALPLPGKLTRTANIIRSYTHQESEIDARFPHNHKFRLFFNISDFPENEALISSELRLTIIVPNEYRSNNNNNNNINSNSSSSSSNDDSRSSNSSSNNSNRDNVRCKDPHIHVYDIIQPGIKGLSQPIKRRIEIARIHVTSSAINLDVLPVIERWLSTRSHNQNHGLLVEVRSLKGETCASHIRLRRSPQLPATDGTATTIPITPAVNNNKANQMDDTRWQVEQPILLLYTEDEQNRQNRKRRSTDLVELERQKRSEQQRLHNEQQQQSKSSRKRRREECRRYPLQIRFKDVGWDDWIVAPSNYHAYYCAGECPTQMGDHLNTTNHAVVQALINSVYPTTIPRPCCMPTSLSPISMLYLNENQKAVLKNYDNMVVEGCGCR